MTASDRQRQERLLRVIRISLAAAVATIALKTTAWLLTGSVGFLSDAAESLVNLAAAAFALFAIHLAARPPDEEHAYGHEKADYFSAGVEGMLVLVAAGTIVVAAVGRLLDPQELTSVGPGVAVAVVAAAINLVVARLLIATGREHDSLTLTADGRHLMTDVWTSAGVVAAVVAVVVTGVEILDPLIALAVAANIVVTGVALLRRSTGGLMDRALSAGELAVLEEVLDRHRCDDVAFHALRTRRAARRAFVSVHVLVPGAWTVQQGHDLIETIERDIREVLSPATVFTHLEPLEDPVSFEDRWLDRRDAGDDDR